MNDMEKLLSSAGKISREIEEFLRTADYENYDDLSGLKIDYEDENQLLLLNEFKGILEKLDSVKSDINYLNRPIKSTGILHKNNRGRYETEFREYSSGYGIEAFIYDEYFEKNRWVITRVEHNGRDYYLVNYRNVPMEGLKVRIRK
jgi:hypothetical protein